MASGDRLLERLRASPTGRSPNDLRRLLKHYGFESFEGRNHTLYHHPELPGDTMVSVPRHRDLRGYVVRSAVKAVDQVLATKEK